MRLAASQGLRSSPLQLAEGPWGQDRPGPCPSVLSLLFHQECCVPSTAGLGDRPLPPRLPLHSLFLGWLRSYLNPSTQQSPSWSLIWAGSLGWSYPVSGPAVLSLRWTTWRPTSPGPSSELQTPVACPLVHAPLRCPNIRLGPISDCGVPPAGLPGHILKPQGVPHAAARGAPLLFSCGRGFPPLKIELEF